MTQEHDTHLPPQVASPSPQLVVTIADAAPSAPTCRQQCRRFGKGVVIVTVVLLLVAIIVSSKDSRKLPELLQWVERRPIAGFCLFLFVYVVCTVAFIPVTILSVAAGAVFGMWAGAALAWLGAMVGETLAFLIGRFLLRGWVKKTARHYPVWRALEAALREEGWKVVVLLRMAPMLPFALINYAMGSTAVPFSSFILASALGIIPGNLMNVYLGTLVKDISDIDAPSKTPRSVRIAILVFSLTSCAAALLGTTLFARHALLRRLAAMQLVDPSDPLDPLHTPLLDPRPATPTPDPGHAPPLEPMRPAGHHPGRAPSRDASHSLGLSAPDKS